MFDMFAGTCTTAVAAYATNRKCLSFEINERCAELGRTRFLAVCAGLERAVHRGLNDISRWQHVTQLMGLNDTPREPAATNRIGKGNIPYATFMEKQDPTVTRDFNVVVKKSLETGKNRSKTIGKGLFITGDKPGKKGSVVGHYWGEWVATKPRSRAPL